MRFERGGIKRHGDNLFLRTELDEFGQPTASIVHGHFNDSSNPDTPTEKVFGRYLSQYLQGRPPALARTATAG